MSTQSRVEMTQMRNAYLDAVKTASEAEARKKVESIFGRSKWAVQESIAQNFPEDAPKGRPCEKPRNSKKIIIGAREAVRASKGLGVYTISSGWSAIISKLLFVQRIAS